MMVKNKYPFTHNTLFILKALLPALFLFVCNFYAKRGYTTFVAQFQQRAIQNI
jgi:hypothetical protein